MTTFKVRLMGSRFIRNVNGVQGRYGFFANHFARADSAEHAGELAIRAVAARSDLRAQLESTRDPSQRLKSRKLLNGKTMSLERNDKGLSGTKKPRTRAQPEPRT
jgi:hypothetical protein